MIVWSLRRIVLLRSVIIPGTSSHVIVVITEFILQLRLLFPSLLVVISGGIIMVAIV